MQLSCLRIIKLLALIEIAKHFDMWLQPFWQPPFPGSTKFATNFKCSNLLESKLNLHPAHAETDAFNLALKCENLATSLVLHLILPKARNCLQSLSVLSVLTDNLSTVLGSRSQQTWCWQICIDSNCTHCCLFYYFT